MVAFVETVYTMAECDGQVEVCVNLTQPQTDILDEVIHLDVVRDDASRHIPPGSVLACKHFVRHTMVSRFLTEPNIPHFYAIALLTDYEEQRAIVNGLRDSSITETSRTVCYNQTVYCDTRLELTEYFGLGIAVRDSTSVKTLTDPVYGQTAVEILDDNSSKWECITQSFVYHQR